MKKRFIALIIAGAMILTMIPAMLAFADESAGEAPDYSKTECWYKIPEISKDVDTFYIYSTVTMSENEGDPDYATLDNAEMLEGVEIEYAIKPSVFEESTNVFIPYYRQASMKIMGETWQKEGNVEAAISSIPYEDLTAALDYYFENYNNGRPFVFAGHSQGSALVRFLLKTYFKDHPEYYDRMVAAYAIGYSITKEDLEENPHLKFATGEDDTGVIISWHTEGPKNAEAKTINAAMLPNGIAINPLNWKRDDTYAPASENLGSLVLNEETGEYEIRDIGADAQVDTTRGTVVTHADAVPNEMVEFSGPESFHQDDYSIFYNNIKDNVAKRIAAYKNQKAAQTETKAATQPTTKAEEPTTEEGLINDGKIFTGRTLILFDPDNRDISMEVSELSQGGWADQNTGKIYYQASGGSLTFTGDDNSTWVLPEYFEEELINGGKIFTGFEQTLYDPDTGATVTLKELSQGGWANEGTGVIYTQEGGGGDHYYGNDGSVLISEWLYYHNGEEGSVDDTEDSVEDGVEEDDFSDDTVEEDSGEENDW